MVGDRAVAVARYESDSATRWAIALRSRASGFRLVDLVEDAAVGEVRRPAPWPSRRTPVVDREAAGSSGSARDRPDRPRLRSARAVVVLGDDLLGLRACRGSRDRPRPPCGCPWRRHWRRRAPPAARRRIETDGTTISNLSAPNSFERQEGLVLPGEQHVADAALGEGHGRAAGAGVEHRHVAEERGDEVARPWPRRRRPSRWHRPRRRDSSSARRPRSWDWA